MKLLGLMLLIPLTLVQQTVLAEQEGEGVSGSVSSLEQKWGVKKPTIRLMGGDFYLAFRYRVIDPSRAEGILERVDEAKLFDAVSGRPLPVSVSVLGRQDKAVFKRETKDLVMIAFSNPKKILKRGSRVTVVIGDFKAENLTVR